MINDDAAANAAHECKGPYSKVGFRRKKKREKGKCDVEKHFFCPEEGELQSRCALKAVSGRCSAASTCRTNDKEAGCFFFLLR